MNDTLKTDELDLDYILIVKDKDILINEIDFTDKERLLCSSIIDNLEQQANDAILDGQCVSIPFLGTIQKNWYRSKVISHYKEFKQVRETLPKEAYIEYVREVMQNELKEHKEEEAKVKQLNRYKRKVLPKYLELVNKYGVAYANAWLVTRQKFEVVEFDEEIEEIYERFGR